jgi:predicted nucleic-acid-binding Zn-ribbon protein
MSHTPKQCPKCDSQMEQGFALAGYMTYGGRLVSHWAPGAPVKSFWSGTKPTAEKPIPIGVFRCASCGYLESYARDEFAAQ